MILNIHGYMGNQHNTLFNILTDLGVNQQDILSPQIDYDSTDPERVIKNLSVIIENNSRDVELIIANSFGGFFGYMLAAKYSIPIILVNPCLMPFITIYSISETYNPKFKRALLLMFGSNMWTLPLSLCTVIVGTDDNIIDHEKITYPLLPCTWYNVIKGMNHSISDNDIEAVRNIVDKAIQHYRKNGTTILKQIGEL